MDSSIQIKLKSEINPINYVITKKKENKKHNRKNQKKALPNIKKQNIPIKKSKKFIIIYIIIFIIFLIILAILIILIIYYIKKKTNKSKENHILHFNSYENKSINYFNNNSNNNIIIINETYINKSDKYDLKNRNDNLNLKHINNKTKILYKINDLKYNFSFKFNIVEVRYNINLYNENRIIIKPSDLPLFYNFHFFCLMKNADNKTTIYSYPKIIHNKDFNCIENFHIFEKVEIGFNIYKHYKNDNLENDIFFALSNEIINYNNKTNEDDNKFDPKIIKDNYIKLIEEIDNFKNNNTKSDQPLLLKSSFIKEPNFSTKGNLKIKNNTWYFENIYNNYFCFCSGLKCLFKIDQDCKYFFYLTIIDQNRYLYNKTHFLLADFFLSYKSTDHAYPIFKELIRQNLSAHYMTEKESIIQEYCKNELVCLKIIIIKNSNKRIDGDFLEKYLELVLKFKSVIAGSDYFAKTNIFHDIEYITYINMGHGVSFFKHFLYKDYLSYKHYDKIVIPPSNIFINIAKKYGWKDENIIKIGYPKWDFYNLINKGIIQQKEEKNTKSIFLMFTWRDIKRGKHISKDYLKNILKILNSERLNRILFNYRIILYFTFHHMINLAKLRISQKRKNILKYIRIEHISEVLSKTHLIISDFSSVIFEIIYRKKPFIIYIPDVKDPYIVNLYNQGYYDIINGLKNGSTYFENTFFDVEAAIDKIIYYITNNFKLEVNLMRFYHMLGLNSANNTMTFVEYLKNL